MSFPRYEKYKDSGISWLGEMPSHWQARRAKFLFDRKQRPVSDDDDIVTAFRDGQVTLRKNRREDGFTVALKEIGYQGVRQGDLVIHAMDAFAGAVGVSDSDGKCSPVYSCCEPKEKVLAPFYGYLVRTMALAGFIESLAKGVRERSTDFRWGDFSSLELPLPPVEEQKQAVSFISNETGKIDALVAEQEKLIGLLKEKRQAVISHAVTKGLNPNARMKDSGVEWLGKIPEHWGLAPLKRLASIDNSGSYGVDPDQGNEILPVATTAQIDSNGNFDVDRMPLRGFTTDEVSKYRCRSGEILVVKSSGSATNIISGKAGIVSEKTPIFVFSNFLLRIAPKKAEVVPEYMYALLVSHLTKERIKMMVSTTTYPNLQVGEYSSALLPLPPLSEQQAIVTFLNHETGKIDALIEAAQRAIELMKERRTALISAAVTGKIDVSKAQ